MGDENQNPPSEKPKLSADEIEESGKRKRKSLEEKVSRLEDENSTLKETLESFKTDMTKMFDSFKAKPASDPKKAEQGKSFFDEVAEWFNKPLFLFLFLLLPSTLKAADVQLVWDPNPVTLGTNGATLGYNVYWTNAANLTWQFYTNLPGRLTTNVSVFPLLTGQQYYGFTVTATNAVSESPKAIPATFFFTTVPMVPTRLRAIPQ